LNSKKEVLIASILAVILASGLGTVSYGFFGDIPILEKLQSGLDVYTQKGGLGPNTSSGSFALNESVVLYGEIRDQVNETGPDKLVAFEVKANHGEILVFMLVRPTNTSGIATAVFRIPADSSFVGIWEVYARAEFNETVLLDTVTFKCEPQG